jgi:shikimate dehydrogenase
MRVAAVIGNPARHSRSPLIHGHWLAELGLTGAYLRLELDEAAAEAALRDLGSLGLVGANITIPHKELAFRIVSEMDEPSRAVGAINTVWWEAGRLLGTNTDGVGFLANLDDRAPGWDRRAGTAVVLGAGGSARAVLHALLARGFGRVVVANRTLARAEELVAGLGSRTVAVDLAEADRFGTEADLVVNTTALGMKGAGLPPLDLNRLRNDAVVTDIVYVPLETPFLSAARGRGLRVVDGLGMLLHQAVPGFERWFGVRPAVTPELRAVVAADLGL